MIVAYIYSTKSGVFLEEKSGSLDIITQGLFPNTYFTTIAPPNYKHTWRWVDTEWVELLPINNPDIPYGDEYVWNEEQNQWVISPELDAYKYLEQQKEAWENIKARRLQAVTSGVYIPSLDRSVHTDATTVAQYGQIGSSIVLGTFEEMNWKAMDGTFFNMTEDVFKEIQTEMMRKTQANHANAEYHKVMMEASDEPLEYDFSSGWI